MLDKHDVWVRMARVMCWRPGKNIPRLSIEAWWETNNLNRSTQSQRQVMAWARKEHPRSEIFRKKRASGCTEDPLIRYVNPLSSEKNTTYSNQIYKFHYIFCLFPMLLKIRSDKAADAQETEKHTGTCVYSWSTWTNALSTLGRTSILSWSCWLISWAFHRGVFPSITMSTSTK